MTLYYINIAYIYTYVQVNVSKVELLAETVSYKLRSYCILL